MENIQINNNLNTNSKITKFQEYSLYFFIFAVFGWIMETVYSFIILGHFTERGFLYGPLCPIYGYGALIMILFLNKYKQNPIKLFFFSSIIFSTFEYFVSYILEALFNMYFWDYTYDFANLNGRIALFYSFAWGFIAILFNYCIYPVLKKIIDKITTKIPYKFTKYFMIVTYIAYITDTILSCVRYLQ